MRFGGIGRIWDSTEEVPQQVPLIRADGIRKACLMRGAHSSHPSAAMLKPTVFGS